MCIILGVILTTQTRYVVSQTSYSGILNPYQVISILEAVVASISVGNFTQLLTDDVLRHCNSKGNLLPINSSQEILFTLGNTNSNLLIETFTNGRTFVIASNKNSDSFKQVLQGEHPKRVDIGLDKVI